MKKADDKLTFLKTALFQKDMRIRLPKCIIENMNIKTGETEFEIYISGNKEELILKVKNEKGKNL